MENEVGVVLVNLVNGIGSGVAPEWLKAMREIESEPEFEDAHPILIYFTGRADLLASMAAQEQVDVRLWLWDDIDRYGALIEALDETV